MTRQPGAPGSSAFATAATANAWLGENIAVGNGDAATTFEQWRGSPGHNANMLGVNYTTIGIGRAYNATSQYSWYWTTDFASVSDGYDAATPGLRRLADRDASFDIYTRNSADLRAAAVTTVR